MDAYRPGWPSLEREETHCNRIWHCYFSGVGFEELFLDAKVLGSIIHSSEAGVWKTDASWWGF
jgi:hypothetical protein